MKNTRKLPFGVARGVRATELSALKVILEEFYGEAKRNEISELAYLRYRLKGTCSQTIVYQGKSRELLVSKSVRVIRRLNLVGNLRKSYSERSLSSLSKEEVEAYASWLENYEIQKWNGCGALHQGAPCTSEDTGEKQKKTSKINAEFLACATELAPELVQRFCEEKTVILIKFYDLPSCVKKPPNIFKPVLANRQQHQTPAKTPSPT